MASLADQDNHFYGFEVDIMHTICQRMNMPCTFKGVTPSSIPDDLVNQKIDLAIAAIIIPSDPILGYIFSLPYLASNAEFLTTKQSSIQGPADIIHKRVGVRRGTLMGGRLFANFVSKLYQGKVVILEYADINELIDALNNNKVDVIFANAVAADYWLVNNTNLYRIIGTRIPVGDGYGIMTNLGQEALIDKINKALLSMEADGTYLAIYTRYFAS
jgi:arginine transport system substrate-binding protein